MINSNISKAAARATKAITSVKGNKHPVYRYGTVMSTAGVMLFVALDASPPGADLIPVWNACGASVGSRIIAISNGSQLLAIGGIGEAGNIGPPGPPGPIGPPGPSNVLGIGTVSSGSQAAASITGTSPSQTLNLTLPKGDKGDKGDIGAADKLNVGTVTSGSPAAASITGTSPNRLLNLTLPKGDKGDKGDIGNSLGTYYGTTSTAAGTVTKTVACPEMAAYVKGHRLTVLFTPAHTATSMSLNVNGLGALGVYYKNSNTIPTGLITANSIHDFTYDGTRFRYVASGGACPFPVNSIYLSMSSSNPNAYWPGTTWSQVSQGRMLVGVSSQDIDFNAANKTGGTKTHHHKYNIAGREWYGALVGDIGNGLFAYDYPNSAWKSATSVGSSTINRNSALVAGMTQTLTTATATGDVGTSIESGLPPYLSVYIWQRTV